MNLSELIKECGDNFLNLYRTDTEPHWHCTIIYEDFDTTDGDTPEEAISKLLEIIKQEELKSKNNKHKHL